MKLQSFENDMRTRYQIQSALPSPVPTGLLDQLSIRIVIRQHLCGNSVPCLGRKRTGIHKLLQGTFSELAVLDIPHSPQEFACFVICVPTRIQESSFAQKFFQTSPKPLKCLRSGHW